MRPGTYKLGLLPLYIASLSFCLAAPWPGLLLTRRAADSASIDADPTSGTDDNSSASPNAFQESPYLGAQIGGIVGSYAVSLVLVAIGLLALAKRRREHLRAGEDPDAYLLEVPNFQFPEPLTKPGNHQEFPYPLQTPKSPYRNFSYPDPLSPTRTEHSTFSPHVSSSPTSIGRGPGVDLAVDQLVVAQDRKMAQQQLEDMYKYVMEQEAAKEEGREYEGPPLPVPQPKASASAPQGILKKEKNKPANLNLDGEKTQSRASSILSLLKSPRKKNFKGVNISSPIMTPMSGTFPRQEGEEMSGIPPRQYAPPPPPPVPTDQLPFRGRNAGNNLPLTPETSPTSTISIDGRLDAALAQPREARDSRAPSHSRDISVGASTNADADPDSAISATSTTPLVGLPSSPKPGVNRFPSLSSLPSSPKPGQTFQRPNAPSAVRTGGSLPLRAYEPSLASPRSQSTKQTVFTRASPLSPGLNTPFTGAAVPYSPYQPFSPVMPITPSLVTKADRKRMKRLEPKTPTLEMVKSSDEIW